MGIWWIADQARKPVEVMSEQQGDQVQVYLGEISHIQAWRRKETCHSLGRNLTISPAGGVDSVLQIKHWHQSRKLSIKSGFLRFVVLFCIRDWGEINTKTRWSAAGSHQVSKKELTAKVADNLKVWIIHLKYRVLSSTSN